MILLAQSERRIWAYLAELTARVRSVTVYMDQNVGRLDANAEDFVQ